MSQEEQNRINAIDEISIRIKAVKSLSKNFVEGECVCVYEKLEAIDNLLFDIDDYINELKDGSKFQ